MQSLILEYLIYLLSVHFPVSLDTGNLIFLIVVSVGVNAFGKNFISYLEMYPVTTVFSKVIVQTWCKIFRGLIRAQWWIVVILESLKWRKGTKRLARLAWAILLCLTYYRLTDKPNFDKKTGIYVLMTPVILFRNNLL